jgi:uncharacterized coiled-coil DUF342 family protein
LAKQQQQDVSARRSVNELLQEQVPLLNAEISKVEERIQPLVARADEIQLEIDQLKEEQRDLARQRREIEGADLIPLRQELSRASIALGGRRLSDNPAT